MGQNPLVLEAMRRALEKVVQDQVALNMSGTTHYHVELKKKVASLVERMALFSGYISNEATLSTLSSLKGCVVFSDELNHSSMIQLG